MSVNEDFKELQSIFSTDVSRHEATCRTKNKKAVKKKFWFHSDDDQTTEQAAQKCCGDFIPDGVSRLTKQGPVNPCLGGAFIHAIYSHLFQPQLFSISMKQGLLLLMEQSWVLPPAGLLVVSKIWRPLGWDSSRYTPTSTSTRSQVQVEGEDLDSFVAHESKELGLT